MVRRLFLRLFPGLAERAEAESRTWMMRCPRCHHEVSVWEAGGIRYKASGTVWRLGRCRRCRRVAMLKVYRRDGPAPDPGR